MRRVPILPVGLLALGAVAAAVVLATSSASVETPSSPSAVGGSPGLYGLGLSRLPAGSEYRRMARGGAGTVRFVLDWRRAEPTAKGGFHWGQSDRYIGRAAKNGIAVMPVLFATPGWLAPSFIQAPVFSAKAQRKWRGFVRAAVARYGRGGSFWAGHPDLPYDPVRDWQVWNEQNSPDFWAPKPSARAYQRLLSISAVTLRHIDPKSGVVLGGMFETGTKFPNAIVSWRFLGRLYRLGARKEFDVVGVHPYSPTFSGFTYQLDRMAQVIHRYHDSHTPMWIDEIGWGSGRGGSPQNKGLRGQATILSRAFHFAARNRNRLGIERIMWFPWRDSGHTPTQCSFCGVTGLIHSNGTPKPSWRAFRRIAAR